MAGGTFPAEIWGDYMKAVKGRFCGDFPPPKTPFQSSPFFGKYSRGGGRGTGDGRPERHDAVRAHVPTTPVPTTPEPTTSPRTAAGTGNGGGNGNGTATAATSGNFDPELYESPPQGAPPAADPGGGADGAQRLTAARTPGINQPSSAVHRAVSACGKAVPGSTTSRIGESE